MLGLVLLPLLKGMVTSIHLPYRLVSVMVKRTRVLEELSTVFTSTPLEMTAEVLYTTLVSPRVTHQPGLVPLAA